MRLKPINQQVVVLMGASSGMGREAAIQFARRGAKVVVSARDQSGLDSLVDQIRREGGEVTAIVADVLHFDQMKAVADTAVTQYGRLDTWVHLAAVSVYATFEDTTPEEFKQVIDVNLVGQAYGAMAALPYLRREGRGALIHISSVEGKRALPFQSAYAASKHGMLGFIEALRMELEHEGIPISVTNIMPAAINTPFFNKARTKIGVKPKGLPPIYQPSVVVEAILHAAEHPTRDIFAGGAARMLALGQSLSPKIMDMLFKQAGFKGQQTSQPKSEAAPDNLFAPLEGYDRIEGDFGAQAMSGSLYTSMQTSSGLSTVLAGLAAGVVTGLTMRALRNNGG
jgi:NAD(P)-dependent dehydrogenase (short-subunit alcohol dehydrogenase family)